MNEEYKQLVNFYIRAKDRHQPHFMELAFAKNAILKMEVNTDAISFPTETVGLDNITETLVSEFHVRFDNVNTICISDSIVELEDELRCQWLVAMTDIESGSLRIGYGDYHWKFNKQNVDDKLRVQQLSIFINSMIELPAESASSVLPWLDALSHPWVSFADMALSAPDLSIIRDFLKLGGQVN